MRTSFASLCEEWIHTPARMNEYGYWITASGKIVPVGNDGSHIETLIEFGTLPTSVQNIINPVLAEFGNDETGALDYLVSNCEKLYDVLAKEGWIRITTYAPDSIVFNINRVSSKIKNRIADFLLSIPDRDLDRELIIYQLSGGVERYNTCREFLRGGE